MFMRWIGPCAFLCLLTSSVCAQQSGSPPVRTIGQLAQEPYAPQPGDLIFFDEFNKLHHLAYKFSGTGGPTHVGVVIARCDGTLGFFDITGPRVAFARVSVTDLDARLHNFGGMIVVRRIRQPLTDEQSRDLTCFAYAQQGRHFAMFRVLLQGTPFNARSGLRQALFGKTHLDRNRWFCSEIVVAGCTIAGVLDPRVIHGNATYPRDLAYDETLDLSHLYHPAALWQK
jgi:hypothetical protein